MADVVNLPNTSFTAEPISGTAPLDVQFTDTTTANASYNYSVPWVQQTANAGWNERQSPYVVTLPDGSIVLMQGSASSVLVNSNETWVSADQGITWTDITNNPPFSGLEYMRIITMPDDSIIKIGGMLHSGEIGLDGIELTGNYYAHDVWRSTDKGATWTLKNASAPWSDRWINGVHPLSDGSIVVFGKGNGDAWRSTDLGSTWVQQTANMNIGNPANFASVVLPDDSIVITGGANTGAGNPSALYNNTYRSVDKGVTWQTVNTSPGWIAREDHGMAVLANGTILLMGGYGTYGSVVHEVDMNDIWKSSDRGNTWQLVTAHAEWPGQILSLRVVHMPDDSIIFTDYNTGRDLWKSVNGGATWTHPITYAGISRTAAENIATSDGSIIRFGGVADLTPNTNDVWRSTNKGVTWTNVNSSMFHTGSRPSLSVCVLPNGDIIAGGGHNGNWYTDVWKSTNQGSTWTEVNASLDAIVGYPSQMIALPNGDILLPGGETLNGDLSNSIWKSSDEGATWTQLVEHAEWSPRMVGGSVVLSDGSIVIAGGDDYDVPLGDVWRSTDEGLSWTEMNGTYDTECDGTNWCSRTSSVMIAMPDDSIVITSGFEGDYWDVFNDVWRSTDKGATWTRLPDSVFDGNLKSSGVGLPDGSLVIMGSIGNSMTNDVWRFNPVSDLNLPTAWNWSFGDGNISSLQNPVNRYSDCGQNYTISLNASNTAGNNVSTRTDYISTDSCPSPEPVVTSSHGALLVGSDSPVAGSSSSIIDTFQIGVGLLAILIIVMVATIVLSMLSRMGIMEGIIPGSIKNASVTQLLGLLVGMVIVLTVAIMIVSV